MTRVLRISVALFVAVTASLAAAIELPPDAELIITSDDSTIVGFGRSTDGARFELTVLPSYSGPATLTLWLPDGTASHLDVVLDAGRVTVDGSALTELLRGYDEIRVDVADDGVPASDASPAQRPNVGREDPSASPEGPSVTPDSGPPDAAEPSQDAVPDDVRDEVPNQPGGAAGGGESEDDAGAPPDAAPPDTAPDAAPEDPGPAVPGQR